MNFSEKLSCLRKEKNLSQERFAEVMNVSRQAVSKWESGQSFPDIDKLIEISNYFNVSIDSLVKEGEIELKKEKVEEKASETENDILRSRNKRMLLSALATVCICICLTALTTVDQSRNRYQAILLVVYCMIGISVSIYGLVKVKKKSKYRN